MIFEFINFHSYKDYSCDISLFIVYTYKVHTYKVHSYNKLHNYK